MKHEFNYNALLQAGWLDGANRPLDQQLVVYLFEPFMTIYVGRYEESTDSVSGTAGFTTWCPEVLCWISIPG